MLKVIEPPSHTAVAEGVTDKPAFGKGLIVAVVGAEAVE
jgi:hypothetical protein